MSTTAMNIILWHRNVLGPEDRQKALAGADRFRLEAEATLPRPYKDKEGRVVGRVVRVWTVDAGVAVMVAARVDLGKARP